MRVPNAHVNGISQFVRAFFFFGSFLTFIFLWRKARRSYLHHIHSTLLGILHVS